MTCKYCKERVYLGDRTGLRAGVVRPGRGEVLNPAPTFHFRCNPDLPLGLFSEEWYFYLYWRMEQIQETQIRFQKEVMAHLWIIHEVLHKLPERYLEKYQDEYFDLLRPVRPIDENADDWLAEEAPE